MTTPFGASPSNLENGKHMTDESNASKENEIDELIDEILNESAGQEQPNGTTEGSATPSPLSALAANPDLLSKLPELISVMKPLLGGNASTSIETDKRLALLCAMKPYLSPKRCEAIDYITKMSKLGDTLKHIKL